MGDRSRPTGMPALVVPAVGSADISADVLERAREFVDASVSWNTRRAYKSDYGLYQSWCESRSLRPMPASPAAIVAYLIFLADGGHKVATIERHYATISKAFRIAGVAPSPCEDPAVRQVWPGSGARSARRRSERKRPWPRSCASWWPRREKTRTGST